MSWTSPRQRRCRSASPVRGRSSGPARPDQHRTSAVVLTAVVVVVTLGAFFGPVLVVVFVTVTCVGGTCLVGLCVPCGLGGIRLRRGFGVPPRRGAAVGVVRSRALEEPAGSAGERRAHGRELRVVLRVIH